MSVGKAMIASSRSSSSSHRRIWLSPDDTPPVKSGLPFSTITIRPLSSSLSKADCTKSICISPDPGRPAPQRLLSFPFWNSSLTASSTPSLASFPPHGVPNGGFSITKRIFCFGKQSFFIVSCKRMLSAFCPLIIISARHIAYDSGLISCPYSATSASGFRWRMKL